MRHTERRNSSGSSSRASFFRDVVIMLSVVCKIFLSVRYPVVQGGAGVAAPSALTPWYGGRFSSAWRNNIVFFCLFFVTSAVRFVNFFSSKARLAAGRGARLDCIGKVAKCNRILSIIITVARVSGGIRRHDNLQPLFLWHAISLFLSPSASSFPRRRMPTTNTTPSPVASLYFLYIPALMSSPRRWKTSWFAWPT